LSVLGRYGAIVGLRARGALAMIIFSTDMRTPSFPTPCLVQFVLYIYMTKSPGTTDHESRACHEPSAPWCHMLLHILCVALRCSFIACRAALWRTAPQ
jgi:hypothetical protein